MASSLDQVLAGGSDAFFCRCDYCGDDHEAVGFCTNCEDYLCADCFRTHLKPKSLRNHVLLDSSQMPCPDMRRRRDTYNDTGSKGNCGEMKGLSVGTRIVWMSDSGPEPGVVKWIGILPNTVVPDDITVGVEFDNPVGSGTGKYKDTRLFYAKQAHASLVPIMGLVKEAEFYEGAQSSDNSVFRGCDYYADDREAIGFCTNCEDYLCADCFRIHLKPKLLQHHVVLDRCRMACPDPRHRRGSDGDTTSKVQRPLR